MDPPLRAASPQSLPLIASPRILNPADNFQDILPARFAARQEGRTFRARKNGIIKNKALANTGLP